MSELNVKLIEATKQNDKEEVQRLIELKADINYQEGNTPLHLALANGHVELAFLLICAYKPNLSLQNKVCCTPFYSACSFGHSTVVALLIQLKTDVNFTARPEGFTPLSVASEQGHTEIVHLLIQHKANVNLEGKGEDGMTLFYSKNKSCGTPLSNACKNGHGDIVVLLLANKADPKLTDPVYKSIPFENAVATGHVEVVAHLIQHKANVNSLDHNGHTPLWTATTKPDVAALLIQSKADINQQRPSLLHAAVGNEATVGLLLACKADPKRIENGQTAQQWAEKLARTQSHSYGRSGEIFDEYKQDPKRFKEERERLFQKSKETMANCSKKEKQLIEEFRKGAAAAREVDISAGDTSI